MFIPGWIPQRTSYGFGYGPPWSSAGFIHALEGASIFVVCLRGGTCAGGVVFVIIYNIRSGGCLCHRLS